MYIYIYICICTIDVTLKGYSMGRVGIHNGRQLILHFIHVLSGLLGVLLSEVVF